MDGILSGFLFSRKKDLAKRDSQNKPDTSAVEHADSLMADSFAADSLLDRSDLMRLTKNEPSVDFDNDSITDFGFAPGAATDTGSRVTELARAKSSPTAIIGPKISFKGELSGEEDLLIQGRVEGSIDLKGNHLTIGSQGVIKANVAARTITVEGTVEGDIVATEHIAIKSASHVRGNLKAERVTLEDGAKFRGSIDMDMEADTKASTHKAAISSTASASSLSTQDNQSGSDTK